MKHQKGTLEILTEFNNWRWWAKMENRREKNFVMEIERKMEVLPPADPEFIWEVQSAMAGTKKHAELIIQGWEPVGFTALQVQS